jgi:hypothetical protein
LDLGYNFGITHDKAKDSLLNISVADFSQYGTGSEQMKIVPEIERNKQMLGGRWFSSTVDCFVF